MSTVVLASEKALSSRHYFRPFFVEPEEWFGPAPEGVYDVGEFLKTLPAPFNNPDLLLVSFEFGMFSRPVNLVGVRCPKVLLVSDTHHQVRPITNVLNHALAEPYDLILGQFLRQHLHFFREAGLTQTVWIPGFTLHPFEMQPAAKCRDTLFVGATAHHPFRRHIFGSLESKGIHVNVGTAGPDFAALEYSRTHINLNISLNGDLNLRNFEILAANGFLVADRLSPESGLELLFQDRRHLALFDSVDHLHELITYYLAHPQEAAAIAAQGHAQYLLHHTPARKIQQLREALAGRITPEYSLDLDLRTRLPQESLPRLRERILLYECLQEVYRNNAQLEVLFWEGLDREATDAADMPRLKASLLGRPGAGPVDACGMQSRIERIDLSLNSLGSRRWAFLCVSPDSLDDPLFHAALQQRNFQYLMVPHFDAQVHMPTLTALMTRYGLTRVEQSFPPLLALPGVALTFT